MGYSDGYWAMIPLRKLKKRHVQEHVKTSVGGQKSLGSDRVPVAMLVRSLSEGGVQEVWWKRVQWPVENDSLIDVTRETGLMHERYVGVAFEKVFGELGVFIGVVQEVWRNDQGNIRRWGL